MIQTGPGMAYQPQPGYAPALPIPQPPQPTGAVPAFQPDHFAPTAPQPSIPPAAPYLAPLPAPIPTAYPTQAPLPAPIPTAYPVQPLPMPPAPVPQGSLLDAFRSAAQRLWAHIQGPWQPPLPSQPPVMLPAPWPQPPVSLPEAPIVPTPLPVPVLLPQPPVAQPEAPEAPLPIPAPAPLPQPPVAQPEAPVAPVPIPAPAPLPQPPVAQPEAPVAPAPPPAPVAEPQPAPVPLPESKPQPKPEAKPQPKPESKPQPKPEAKPQPKPEAKPQPKPKPKPKDPGTGPLMKFGAEGAPVKAMQQRLRKLGVSPGTPDGDFGPKTEDAVKRFQRREGLRPTGVVNGKTWNELGIDVKGKVKYPAWGIKRAGNMAKIQGHRMTMATARAFSKMAQAAARDGITLRINSGYRSDAEQRVLFNAALKKYGSYSEASKWVAPPGTSTHRSGRTLDIENLAFPGAYNWLAKNGRKYGFVQTMSWEPWHWEFKG